MDLDLRVKVTRVEVGGVGSDVFASNFFLHIEVLEAEEEKVEEGNEAATATPGVRRRRNTTPGETSALTVYC